MVAWDDVVDELYGGTLDDFVARRDAAVRAARAAKDRDLAGRIGSLRKPTVAAWAVNLLVRDDAALAGALRDLGEGMREAERSLDGLALRELGKQRRALVGGLVARARRLVADNGQKLTTAAAQEVEHTLTAALADPGVADAVAAGTLTHGTEHVGFGSASTVTADREGLPSLSDGNPSQSPRGQGRTGLGARARRGAKGASSGGTRATSEAPAAPPREQVRREREQERLRRRHEQAVAAREAAEAELERARTRHEDTAAAEQEAVRALEAAEQASGDAYAAEEELVRALADVRRRLADARAALPRVDESLVAARAAARDREKAVRAAARELDRSTKAAERAREQEQRAADDLG